MNYFRTRNEHQRKQCMLNDRKLAFRSTRTICAHFLLESLFSIRQNRQYLPNMMMMTTANASPEFPIFCNHLPLSHSERASGIVSFRCRCWQSMPMVERAVFFRISPQTQSDRVPYGNGMGIEWNLFRCSRSISATNQLFSLPPAPSPSLFPSIFLLSIRITDSFDRLSLVVPMHQSKSGMWKPIGRLLGPRKIN